MSVSLSEPNYELCILGATGSIGRQTLDVCRQEPRLHPRVLAAGCNWQALATQAREFRPELVVTADEAAYAPLKAALADLPIRVEAGLAALCQAAAWPEVDTVVAAISGMAGLPPLLAAIEAGKDIALANKEALVCGGALVTGEAARRRVRLLPVDSEHSALWQCLQGEDRADVARLIITASGGAFRELPEEALAQVTAADALRHPTWRMGPKITVDCATMANKGLEVIEAHWLFDIDYDRIQAVLHPESSVHSLVAFRDGSIKAQLALADMRLPIRYALLRQERPAVAAPAFDFSQALTLHFQPLPTQRYPAFAAFIRAGRAGGLWPAYLNGANEELNAAFLAGRLPFPAIGSLLARFSADLPTTNHREEPAFSLDDIFAADSRGRQAARTAMEEQA